MSVEAADIYKQEQENGVAVGYKLPEDKSDAYFRLFKVLLDASLDSAELEKAYKRICRKKFSFSDKYGNAYTLAVVNVKFNYIYKPQVGFEDGVDGGQQHPANSNKNKTLANRTICFITFCAFRRKEWS